MSAMDPSFPSTGQVNGRPLTRLTVFQGQCRVSAGPRVELTTVLGSCIATCLFDPEVEVGGMNHFLLAEPMSKSEEASVDEHYGVYLMEVLINEMLSQGAAKQRLRAHIYGGANMHAGMSQIGSKNAEFAREFLARERIQLVREHLGGNQARRVDFRPASGQVRCRSAESSLLTPNQPVATPAISRGEVELF